MARRVDDDLTLWEVLDEAPARRSGRRRHSTSGPPTPTSCAKSPSASVSPTFRLGAANSLCQRRDLPWGPRRGRTRTSTLMIRVAAETGLTSARWSAAKHSGVATIARWAHRRGRTGCERSVPDREPERGARRVRLLRGSDLRDSSRPGTPRRDHRARRTGSGRESRGLRVYRAALAIRPLRSRPTRRRPSGLRAACRQPLHRLPLRCSHGSPP